jgi:predicted nuclease of predicted toxin-antitoxin system
MRILLDECLPARLRYEIKGHEVMTVKDAGWLGIKNGRLLKLIGDSAKFDVFLTVDKNLPKQQSLRMSPFAVIVLRAKSNRFQDLRPLVLELLRRLPKARAGETLEISVLD